ncbi:unnamed protein product [Heterosigma akashiwo]
MQKTTSGSLQAALFDTLPFLLPFFCAHTKCLQPCCNTLASYQTESDRLRLVFATKPLRFEALENGSSKQAFVFLHFTHEQIVICMHCLCFVANLHSSKPSLLV